MPGLCSPAALPPPTPAVTGGEISQSCDDLHVSPENPLLGPRLLGIVPYLANQSLPREMPGRWGLGASIPSSGMLLPGSPSHHGPRHIAPAARPGQPCSFGPRAPSRLSMCLMTPRPAAPPVLFLPQENPCPLSTYGSGNFHSRPGEAG